MPGQVTIALIQMDCRLGDVKYNVEHAEALIRQGAERGADIICLPELGLTGYRQDLLGPKLWDIAEGVPGPITDRFAKLARDLDVYLIIPLNEKDSVPYLLHNSAVFIDRQGHVQGVYRKVHAYATENHYFTSGDRYPVFETEFGKVGIMICYDMGFPEVARILTLQGAEIVFGPSAWCREDEDIWDINIAARALENRLFVAAVNRVGDEGDLTFLGRSKVVNTRGKTLAQSPNFREDVLVTTLDLHELYEGRRETPYLKDRKPATYGLLTRIN